MQSKNQVHLSTVLSFKNLTGDEQSLSQTYSYDKFFISRVIFYPREIQRNFHFESFNILQHSDIVILIKILKCRWYWHITLMVHFLQLWLNTSITLIKSLSSTALKSAVSSWFWLPSFTLCTSYQGTQGVTDVQYLNEWMGCQHDRCLCCFAGLLWHWMVKCNLSTVKLGLPEPLGDASHR